MRGCDVPEQNQRVIRRRRVRIMGIDFFIKKAPSRKKGLGKIVI